MRLYLRCSLSARAMLSFAVVSVASISMAAHYYVSPSGDDGNAGTSVSAAFKTIQAGADAALSPGDTVTVMAGTYKERVLVKGEGTKDNPIVFLADGDAILDGTGLDNMGFVPDEWNGVHSGGGENGNDWVTIDGFTFKDFQYTSGNDNDMVTINPSDGWVVQGCTFIRVHLAINIRGHNAKILDCDFDSLYSHACVACNSNNIVVKDVTIRNGNLLQEVVSFSAVNKFLLTDTVLVENIVSEGHYGPGWWFDSENYHFVFRNNVIRNCRGRIGQPDWEGPGMWIETNKNSNSQIYNNLIENCTGAGICIMESQDLDIHNNVVRDCGSAVELRHWGVDTTYDRGPITNVNFHDNFFDGWVSAGVATSIGEWGTLVLDSGTFEWSPEANNLVFDNNYYCQPGGKPLFSFIGQQYQTLADVRSGLGFEANGEINCDPGDIITTSSYHVAAHRQMSDTPTFLKVVGNRLPVDVRGMTAGASVHVYDLQGKRIGATRADDRRAIGPGAQRVAKGMYIVKEFAGE